MMDIELQAVANQSLSVQLDGARYDVTLREAGGVMAADVARDGVALVTGARVLAKVPLLPYAYQQVGNLVILTEDDAFPYYTEFGQTQFLVYVTPDEIAQYAGT